MAHVTIHVQQIVVGKKRGWRVHAGSTAGGGIADETFHKQSTMSKALKSSIDQGLAAGNTIEVIEIDLSGAGEKVVYTPNGRVKRTLTSVGAEVVHPRCSPIPLGTPGQKKRAANLRQGARLGAPPKTETTPRKRVKKEKEAEAKAEKPRGRPGRKPLPIERVKSATLMQKSHAQLAALLHETVGRPASRSLADVPKKALIKAIRAKAYGPAYDTLPSAKAKPAKAEKPAKVTKPKAEKPAKVTKPKAEPKVKPTRTRVAKPKPAPVVAPVIVEEPVVVAPRPASARPASARPASARPISLPPAPAERAIPSHERRQRAAEAAIAAAWD